MQPNEWSTIYSSQDYTLPEGIDAFIVVGIDYANAKVQVKQVEGIKANTPLLIHKTGTADDYVVTASSITLADAGEQLADNLDNPLQEAFVGAGADGYSYDNIGFAMDKCWSQSSFNAAAYILIGNTFVKWTSGTLAPYRCFLWAVDAFTAPSRMGIEVMDEATGISDASRPNADNKVYDLQGRRVTNSAKKGVYVVGGKKVVVN